MEFATRDQFLKPSPRRYREMTIPGFGKCRIQNMTEGERSKFETSILSSKGGTNRSKLEDSRRRLIALCLVDADGKRLLQDRDADLLRDLDGSVASAIYDACQEHCGFTATDLEQLIEDAETLDIRESAEGDDS